MSARFVIAALVAGFSSLVFAGDQPKPAFGVTGRVTGEVSGEVIRPGTPDRDIDRHVLPDAMPNWPGRKPEVATAPCRVSNQGSRTLPDPSDSETTSGQQPC